MHLALRRSLTGRSATDSAIAGGCLGRRGPLLGYHLDGNFASYLTRFDWHFAGWPCAADRSSTKADLLALGSKLLEPRSLSVLQEDTRLGVER